MGRLTMSGDRWDRVRAAVALNAAHCIANGQPIPLRTKRERVARITTNTGKTPPHVSAAIAALQASWHQCVTPDVA